MWNNKLDYEMMFRKIASVAIAVMLFSSVGLINFQFPINDAFADRQSDNGNAYGKDKGAAPETTTEAAPETTTEAAPETTTEAAPETTTEAAPETTTEAAP
ncbi:MAG TPA: hypothetical protein VD699_05405, partial [Nitrosopumilaceae archaeon]|nr:hypothetical protein [Nitrosopumilaceae archaeon]